jgi:hypothetical protein
MAWRAWVAEVPVKVAGRVTLMARATDGAGETQPHEAEPNAAGYGNNSVHVVRVDARA